MKGLLHSAGFVGHSASLLHLLVLVVWLSAVVASGVTINGGGNSPITTTFPLTGGSSYSGSYSGSSYSTSGPYLANYQPTPSEFVDPEEEVRDYEEYTASPLPMSTSPSPTSTSSEAYVQHHTMYPQHQNGHRHIQPDMPLQLSDILPEDRRSYDKMEPPKREGKPTTVFFHVTVMSLDSIDESSMTYAADIFFSQTWQDYRLRFPDNLTADYRLLPTSWLNSMWRPDSFFKNAKKVTFQDVTIPNHYIWLYKDKSILYMVKLTLILSCSMNFHLYPHDTQQCAMKIESLSHTTDDLVFVWELKTPLVVDDRIELPQLDLVNTVIGDCTQVYSTGNFTCLEVILSFRRRLGYYLFHTYIPTCLIVVMSWISFWIRPEAVPARVTLGVTSLLTLHTQHANSQKALPPVSYIKAIDVFMSGCTVFVFFSLMEYALVNILMGDIIDGEESALKKGMKSMFMTSGSHGSSGSGRVPTTAQQMMEVQPSNSRCLRTNSSAASTSAPMAVPLSNPISRSQSMMATSSSCQAISHQHARYRQHHAAEIHHPDDGSGSVVSGNRSSPSIAARSAIGGSSTRLQPQQREWEREREMQQQPTQSANTPRQQACTRQQPLNNAMHLSQQLNAILPSTDDCPAPPPPSPSTVHRQRNNGTAAAASENGRLPLISSLHSGKMPDSGGHSASVTPPPPPPPSSSVAAAARVANHARYNAANTLNLQQLRRTKAIAIDRISRTCFPLSFFILNVIYWCVFLNSEDVAQNAGSQP